MRLGEHRRRRDRALLDRRQDRAPPRLLQLLELEAGGRRPGSTTPATSVVAPGERQSTSSAGVSARAAGGCRCSSRSRRNASDSRERSDAGPRHLDERELERQARVAALAHVVDGDVRAGRSAGSTVGAAELVRLLAQPLARLVGHRQRIGHLARVLDEHQVPQVLEQVDDEPAEVLALLGELLEEDERAGRVAVDDEVAEPEQHLLLDRAEQLQDVLHA